MIHQIIAITIKDLKVLFHDRGGIVALFLMPAMFILVMSYALQGTFEPTADQPYEVLVVNQDNGELGAEAVKGLEDLDGVTIINTVEDYTLDFEAADALVSAGDYPIAVIFPTDFTDTIMNAATDSTIEKATVSFIVDPSTASQFTAPIQGAVTGLVQNMAATAQAPLRITTAFDEMAAGMPPEQQGFVGQIGAAFSESLNSNTDVQFDEETGVNFAQVAPSNYEIKVYPSSVTQNVPGYTIFGLFFIVQVLASSILQEKTDGTFRRLLVAPLSRPALLLGKLLPYYLINLVQVALMFTIGVLIFGMTLGNHPIALVLVTLATAAAATGMGLLVAAIGKTPEQISGVATLLAITLAAIGGMMVPTFAMPEAMQTISKISPHAWALMGYQDVIVRGLGMAAVVNEISVLLGFAIVFFGIAAWRFRFD
ncbi:MAG: ABC-2 transporter permease [Anaerolineales bacterium]|nr:ABC-2 transporter permease [Anaerolineales bacterium]